MSAFTTSVALWPWIQEMRVADFVTLGSALNVVVPQFPIKRKMQDTFHGCLHCELYGTIILLHFVCIIPSIMGSWLSVGPLNDAILKMKDDR